MSNNKFLCFICVLVLGQLVFSMASFADLRDPTAPLVFGAKLKDSTLAVNKKKSGNKKELTISEIYLGIEKNMVVINGKQYSEEDVVQGYKIKEIQFNKIAISSAAGLKWISLHSENKSGFNLQ